MCARSRQFVNVGVIFLPSVCDSFCVSTLTLGQRCRNFLHEMYGQSTVVFCRSGRELCLTFLNRNSTVFVRFGLHANIVEEHVLLNALLHDQCCLQSSQKFSTSVCVAPFFSNPCLQGWVFSCTCEHESRVSEPVLRC